MSIAKSLFLQLLMTVLRRNSPSDGAVWLQIIAVNVRQLLPMRHIRLSSERNRTQIQKPQPGSRDAAMAWLTECSALARL
jgi:hypothetical protein